MELINYASFKIAGKSIHQEEIIEYKEFVIAFTTGTLSRTATILLWN